MSNSKDELFILRQIAEGKDAQLFECCSDDAKFIEKEIRRLRTKENNCEFLMMTKVADIVCNILIERIKNDKSLMKKLQEK